MLTKKGALLGKYLANVQLDVAIAAYTKVPTTWNEENYTTDFNKLYYIIDGEGFVKVNNQTYYPKPGELYLLPSGSVQSYGTISDNTFEKYWCHFTAKIGNFHLFKLIQIPVFIKVKDWDLKNKFTQLIYHMQCDTFSSSLRVRSILLEIIALFIEQCDTNHFKIDTSPSFKKMDSILLYIEENLDRNLTIETLAQIANFHPNYFIAVFKNFTGSSPIQYINRRKIEKAKELLVVTEESVSGISNSLGMELSYFSRMFKELTGFSPSTYRSYSKNIMS